MRHNGCDKLSFILIYHCLQQGNLCKCISKSLQLLDKEFIYKYEFQNLAMMLLLNIKDACLVNILVLKKNGIKLKQIWIDEIGLNALNQLI